MNGRQAKSLRQLAGLNKDNRQATTYTGDKGTVRKKKIFHPSILNPDGNPLVTHEYTTASYIMNPSARKIYKQLKKAFKRKQGVFSAFA